jgi:hypothetical protein
MLLPAEIESKTLIPALRWLPILTKFYISKGMLTLADTVMTVSHYIHSAWFDVSIYV